MNKRSGFRGSGMGVGYVSVMVIFVTVCLTLFAVLSLRAASSNDAFNERSGEYLKLYYEADNKANRILAELHSAAKDAAKSPFFEDEFELVQMDGVQIRRVRDGCEARYSIKIDERRELLVEIVFKPNGSYEITRRQSNTISTDFDDQQGSLWDGKFNGEMM